MADRIVQQPATVTTQKRFTDLPAADVERSTFDRSHGYKSAFNVGELIPFCVDEVLPADTFNGSATLFLRLATPLKPVMDNIQADVHWFFVPNRILWDSWQLFMGERTDPDDDPTSVTVPQAIIDLDQIEGMLADFMGLPLTDVSRQVTVNALPFRAMAQIWNDWYKDQNLSQNFTYVRGDASVDWTDVGTFPRYKRKDYFTSALPWPQKGDPVYLPLGTTAPVRGIGTQTTNFERTDIAAFETTGLTEYPNAFQVDNSGDEGNAVYLEGTSLEGLPTIYADLAEATAATVNDIRTAFQVQKLLERDARGGTRMVEILLNHFNVQSPDFRLQRAEYLGGGTGNVNINPVASTVATEEAPQGGLAAVGTGIIRGSFNHSFVEHGWVIGLVSCRADLTYQNGIERQWSRTTRYDYYWPSLSHLGEQEIKNKELYVSGDPDQDEGTWAYQERYAEYRYKPGRITGLMRSNASASLDVWHLAQDFDELPGLNTAFMDEAPPIDRVSAVPSEPHFICDAWIKLTCTRAMPIYSVPGLIDHF